MQETTKYLCENIQGCVFGYTQSDEITLILIDYQKLNTSAWFDYEVQKICSIAASMVTIAFNKFFDKNVNDAYEHRYDSGECTLPFDLYRVYKNALSKGAMFDARCFNIPKEEVTNLIYWRQVDATRNSIQMVGQANFSHGELQDKTCNMIQDMLHEQKGINWNDFPTVCKRGTAVIKNRIIIESYIAKLRDSKAKEGEWIIDTEMPILKGEDRAYVDDLIIVSGDRV